MVTDGTSNTLLVGEVIENPNRDHEGHHWITYNVLHTCNGINNAIQDPTSYTWYRDPRTASFASYHPGGCHFARGDGSVDFVDETISPWIMAANTSRADDDLEGITPPPCAEICPTGQAGCE